MRLWLNGKAATMCSVILLDTCLVCHVFAGIDSPWRFASLELNPNIHYTHVVLACKNTCTLSAVHISVVESERLQLRLVSEASRELRTE